MPYIIIIYNLLKLLQCCVTHSPVAGAQLKLLNAIFFLLFWGPDDVLMGDRLGWLYYYNIFSSNNNLL